MDVCDERDRLLSGPILFSLFPSCLNVTAAGAFIIIPYGVRRLVVALVDLDVSVLAVVSKVVVVLNDVVVSNAVVVSNVVVVACDVGVSWEVAVSRDVANTNVVSVS